MGYTGDKKKEYQRKWIAARRAEYLSDKSCVVCGSTDRLEVDHINPEEKISHNVWSWRQERRDKELAKCQILCFEHHKQKSKEDAIARRQHGRTLYAHGCKCDICVEAQRLHNAQRYASKALR
jgi:5-methylcytosine-specific restriction endonuclease McrA